MESFWGKFAFEPVKGEYPQIQMILDHCGRNLTPAVLDDPWCQQNQVTTGGSYLKFWAARLFRDPDKRLPMLDFLSEIQNIGQVHLRPDGGPWDSRRHQWVVRVAEGNHAR